MLPRVFLALPECPAGGKNFTQPADLEGGGAATRYLADTLEVVDENGYGEAKSVQVATKNFRLLFGDQNLDGFVTLRLARVVRNETGAYVLDPAFIAPCLSIASSKYLMGLLRREIEILLAKNESLKANRRQPDKAWPISMPASPGTSGCCTPLTCASRCCSTPGASLVACAQSSGPPCCNWPAPCHILARPQSRRLAPVQSRQPGPVLHRARRQNPHPPDTVIPSKCISIPLRLVERSLWTGTVTNDEHFKNSASSSR